MKKSIIIYSKFDDSDFITQQQKTAALKAKKIQAKLALKEATHSWRIENLRHRELIARDELSKLNAKRAKELKMQTIQQELDKRLDQDEPDLNKDI